MFFHKVNIPLFLFSIFIYICSYFVEAFGWHYMLKFLSVKVKFLKLFSIFYLSGLANYLPLKGAHLAGRVALSAKQGVTVPSASYSLFLELLFSSLACFLMSLLIIPYFYSFSFSPHFFTLLFFFCIFFFPLVIKKSIHLLLRVGSRISPLLSVNTKLPDYWFSFTSILPLFILQRVNRLVFLLTNCFIL